MTKKSKIFLNSIVDFYKSVGSPIESRFLLVKDKIELIDRPPRASFTVPISVRNESYSILRYLHEQKCLSIESDNLSTITFSLTHKGINYAAVQWEATKAFLVKSILVPIGVSVITTLLVLLIRALLQ